MVVGRGVDTVLTRHFEAPRLLVVRDSRPCWQFCHLDDLVEALAVAAASDVQGPLTVGADGWSETAVTVAALAGIASSAAKAGTASTALVASNRARAERERRTVVMGKAVCFFLVLIGAAGLNTS
jgi:nucleoside-diphosphate-sugar epimerase